MCLLSIIPDGAPTPVGALANGLEVNDEGSGWAIIAGGEIAAGRSLNGAFELDLFERIRSKLRNPLAVFHSRLATAGTVSAEGCHPARITGTDSYLFVNGTLPQFMWDPADPRNDAQQAAEDWLPPYLETAEIDRGMKGLSEMIGSCKAVIAAPGGVTVLNEAEFLRADDGVLHSNADYLGKGPGWQEGTDRHGHLCRWNLYQPGQCRRCNRLSCPGGLDFMLCDGQWTPHPPRWRDETARRAKVTELLGLRALERRRRPR